MILPDARCERHGDTLVLYYTVDRGRPTARTYCRACRREAYRARHEIAHNSPLAPRCRRGHLKTPFTHRLYGGKVRCVLCAREQGRLKR